MPRLAARDGRRPGSERVSIAIMQAKRQAARVAAGYRLPPLNVHKVRRCVEEQRALHPEFQRPVTLAGLRAVMMRQDVRFRRAELPVSIYGRATNCFGVFFVTVASDIPAIEAKWVAAHEYANVLLHVSDDRCMARLMAARQGKAAEIQQRWEAEADLFAELLVGPWWKLPLPVAA